MSSRRFESGVAQLERRSAAFFCSCFGLRPGFTVAPGRYEPGQRFRPVFCGAPRLCVFVCACELSVPNQRTSARESSVFHKHPCGCHKHMHEKRADSVYPVR